MHPALLIGSRHAATWRVRLQPHLARVGTQQQQLLAALSPRNHGQTMFIQPCLVTNQAVGTNRRVDGFGVLRQQRRVASRSAGNPLPARRACCRASRSRSQPRAPRRCAHARCSIARPCPRTAAALARRGSVRCRRTSGCSAWCSPANCSGERTRGGAVSAEGGISVNRPSSRLRYSRTEPAAPVKSTRAGSP